MNVTGGVLARRSPVLHAPVRHHVTRRHRPADLPVTAFPLVGRAGRQLGAAAVSWEEEAG
ncbi:MAG: hypothetical protein ACRDV9_02800 [Acidimicrobiia bacterium]